MFVICSYIQGSALLASVFDIVDQSRGAPSPASGSGKRLLAHPR